MSTQARATFDIDSWQEEVYDEAEGARLSRTRVTKTFRGDLEGTSTAELLMARAAEGSAAYVGFERIVGRLSGRSGSFVLHHSATMMAAEQVGTWTVVPDSGTGELRGLRGTGEIAIDTAGKHSFTLEYELA